MPNTKSAIKRMKTSEGRHERSHAEKSRLASTRRRLYEAIAAGSVDDSKSLYRDYCSCLDTAVKHGTIVKNNASRRKSRASARIAAMG